MGGASTNWEACPRFGKHKQFSEVIPAEFPRSVIILKNLSTMSVKINIIVSVCTIIQLLAMSLALINISTSIFF